MKTKNEISTFIQEKIAIELKVSPNKVDLNSPIAAFGLDSIMVMTITSELEAFLKRELDPTIFWEFPNINELATWLVDGNI